MLPKKHRLKSRKEVDQIFKEGRTVRNSFLFLKYKENDLDKSRFAFSIGLKYSKKAVERNEMKRMLRESQRDLIKQVKPGYDGTFFVSIKKSDQNGKIKLDEIRKNMRKTFEKANLLIK